MKGQRSTSFCFYDREDCEVCSNSIESDPETDHSADITSAAVEHAVGIEHLAPHGQGCTCAAMPCAVASGLHGGLPDLDHFKASGRAAFMSHITHQKHTESWTWMLFRVAEREVRWKTA